MIWVTGLGIYRDDGLGGDMQLIYDGTDRLGSNVFYFDVNDLDMGLKYRFHVTAVNWVGEGPYVEKSFYMTLPPGPPRNLRVQYMPWPDLPGTGVQLWPRRALALAATIHCIQVSRYRKHVIK